MIYPWTLVLLLGSLLGFAEQATSFPTRQVVGTTNTQRAIISPESQIHSWNQCRYDNYYHQSLWMGSFPFSLVSRFARKTTTLSLAAIDDHDKASSVDSHDDENNEQQHELYEKILQVAIEASKKAGTIIATNCDGADVVERKSTNRDLLTLVDPLCEKAIRETVVSAFPNHQFLGEEEVDSGIDAAIEALEEKLTKTATSPPDDGFLWIVDPIDGTTNFASGIPLSVPSIAVANRNGEIVVGVIYDPHRDELFTAMKRHGAYMNGQPISVGTQDKIGDAVVGMESPAGQESLDVALKGIVPLMPKVRTIRMLGSSAVMLPWVANGRLTSYWTPDECAWDIAAGSLIVLEAGGTVTDLSGNPYTIRTRKLIASNNDKVHDSILKVLQTEGIM